MIRLSENSYAKAVNPLHKVPFNTLFAQAVVYGYVSGSVYVDDLDGPTTFYISHPYGMSLLVGSSENETFNTALLSYLLNTNKARDGNEWLQVYPEEWNAKFEQILGTRLIKYKDDNERMETNKDSHKIVEYARVNFEFNKSKFKKTEIPLNCKIVQTTRDLFNGLDGNVVPKHFWDSETKFLKTGFGFSLVCKNQTASTAFSAFKIDDQLEIGIETEESFRRKEYALHVCSSLIEHCLENGLEPVWACNKTNKGSFRLAQKLGFEPTRILPCYRLAV